MSDDRIYPCDDCGAMRTKAEGGTVFTVCDKCWDKHHPKPAPVEAERISDEEIDFAIKLGIDAPEHPRQVLAKICKQQQKDISELKAAIQPILSDYHEILNDKLDRQHIYQHDYDKKVALLTKLQARGR